MIIREIEKRDNEQVENLIRMCLIEYGADKPGCAWSDPNLGSFFEVYQTENSKYWVVEVDNKVVAGCGIGPLVGADGVCELQKMYTFKELRGSGIAKNLLDLSLEFAKKYYDKCYLETFANMERANSFYIKNGFNKLDKPIIETQHFACDMWYIKDL